MWDNIIILLRIITFYGSDYYIVEAIVISIICKVKCKKMATHRICNANKFLALPAYTYVSYLLSINNICHMKEYAKWVKLWKELAFSYIS